MHSSSSNIELSDNRTPKNRGAKIVWRNVSVYTTATGSVNSIGSRKKPAKKLINNSNGCVEPGTLLAVMGASGAGKSTLMSALAYRNAAGTIVKGDISVNNQLIAPFMHRLSGFVHQDDLFNGALTVLEHITFMAHLRLDRRVSKSEKIKLVQEILIKVGLIGCVDTRIGDTNRGKTLSGGEKKRLSFASELLTKPSLLFCDEPTTGLDAYSAQQLVRILLALAKQGTTIMCTIHQPSSQLFAMFHQVLLLVDGRMAFMGSPVEAVSFFSNNGFQCPATYNPADFIIGVLATTDNIAESDRVANRLCDAYAVSKIPEYRKLQANIDESSDECIQYYNQNDFRKTFWLVAVYWLVYRNFLIAIRDPAIQKLRIVQKVSIALMAGLCFYGTIDLTQYGIQSVQGALFIIITENTFTPMYSILSLFPQGFPLFIRERRSGLYDTLQYYLSTVIALIPGLIVEPILFAIVGYWLAGLRPTLYAFITTTLISIAVMNISTSCGCLFSIAFNSVPNAIAYLVPFDVALMITSGVFIRLNSIPVYLVWLKYLSWLMYANEAMTIVQWEGVKNISCTGLQLPCLKTAEDIFEQYSFSATNFSSDLWALFVLYLVFNLLAVAILWRRAKKYC